MNADEIRKWHSVFKRPDELFEIRLLGDRTWSGYFYDVEQAIAALQSYDNLNIYYSVNEVKKACASRSQFGQFQMVKGTATSKQDIEHRWWLPIDVDCERPSGVSSTDAEKMLAYNKASEVYTFLLANGLSQPVVCDSSSGYHLMIPIDMDNTQESETIIKTFLETLAYHFTDDKVKIDTVLFDANRIIRLPGSFGRKGRSTEERPHRQARILSFPDPMVRVTSYQLAAFNERYRINVSQPVRRFNNNGAHEEFDIRRFIAQYGIEVEKEVQMPGGGTKFVLKECPWDSGHKAPDSAIFELPNGAIAFKCYHNSCSHHDWRELREKFDPQAYAPRQQEIQYRQIVPRIPQPQQPMIQQETAEKGRKWQRMSDIEKININELPHFKTGFKELDRAIKGLFFFELTIVSGNNASGKSSWLNTVMLNAIQQGEKVGIWSGELRSDVLKSWIQMAACGKASMRKANRGNYWFVPTDIGMKIDKWLDPNLFIYNNEYSNKWEQIFNDMNELLSYGVRIFILDNLFSLDIDIFAGDNNKNQKELIKQITDFCKEKKVHIILVAHPRKVTTFIRKNDISGSSDITNAASNVFIVHRVNNDFLRTGKDFFGSQIDSYKEFGNVVEVCKNRLMGVQDLLCGMYYEIESRRFKNKIDETMIYGWRDDVARQMDIFSEDEGMPFDASDGGEVPF